MLLYHVLHVFGGCVVLNEGIYHLAVFVDSYNGQAENLLRDSKAAGLGGVKGAELQLIAIGFGITVNIGHKGGAGYATVAIEIYQHLTGA